MTDDTFALTHPVVGRDGGDSLDYYPTPRWCTELLFEHAYKVSDGYWPPVRSVLDPAAGDGAILDVARERGFSTYGLELDPVRAACIRRQLIVFGQLMGHGDPRSAKSWRTMGDNELRVRLDHPRSKGRPWARLPVSKYGSALSTLEEMLTRARKVDVAHLEAQQLPLKAS